ncbi:hypothetical protein HDU97_008505 [Phlyctochytrium planicorne]|nr:hypothetical protein HDU97_008505 [Phlyctochytrium planicorne]
MSVKRLMVYSWRDPANFYRTHPLLKATSVPTLYEFNKEGKILQSLNDSESNDEGLLAKFFA